MKIYCNHRRLQVSLLDMRVYYYILTLLLLSAPLFAQLPPSIVYDKDCYFPEIGNKTQGDTIYGNENAQALGFMLFNEGKKPYNSYGRIVTKGLPNHIPFLASFETGPNFNLRSLKDVKRSGFYPDDFRWKYGHYRDRQHLDLLRIRENYASIYWADDSGNYDESRYTDLLSTIKSSEGRNSYSSISVYSTYLTSDTVEDVVYSVITVMLDVTKDSLYLIHFRGGETLHSQGQTAFPDSTLFIGQLKKHLRRDINFADWRGVGRSDAIGFNPEGNGFFYKNDPPFSLQKYANAIFNDTIFTAWENPKLYLGNLSGLGTNLFSMRALPKQPWDSSLDFMPVFPTSDYDLYQATCIYRGGPNFGSKRIYTDSADEILHHPRYYDPGWEGVFTGGQADMGDLTGTGNRVMSTGAASGSSDRLFFFYVLGKAIDDKIDMAIYTDNFSGGYPDTITANDDNLQDVILTYPGYRTQEDKDKGWNGVGSIRIVYGSKSIPVRLNPKYAVINKSTAESELITFPNPLRRSTVLTFSYPKPENVTIELRDVLGRLIYSEEYRAIEGMQSRKVFFPIVASGSYVLSVIGSRNRLSTRVIITE